MKILIFIVVVIVAMVAWIYREQLDREAIVAFAESLPLPVFIAAFLFLPLVGFPITPLLVVAGIRFGFAWGMALATGAIFFHNAAAFQLTHGWFRERLTKKLARSGHAIPSIDPKHQVWFTALFAAIHGPPYAIKLYLLALTEVPFRIYFWIGAPIYAFFCVIPVGAGSAVSTIKPWVIYVLAVTSFILLAGGLLLKGRCLKDNQKPS
ncbi:VTT domain-containing protein [Luteolibacter flavescens]|uniref:VTT domain-containing protein n=1 Tax=Luteolibacter flavescens TaxID=1859460 RepID=A0ABT3FSP0_9BACT|nr:VTT domain-containing protein [Luteolibacter flavescens]MCW1886000.1 VTT domain-containing protein [Luteolibacter flavescens]